MREKSCKRNWKDGEHACIADSMNNNDGGIMNDVSSKPTYIMINKLTSYQPW
jgi:hypothetical protein